MMICPRCMRQFDDATEACPDDGVRLRAFRDQTSQLVGRVLDGRWAIIDKIGEGGMGEVYRARQTNVDRIVAVKVLRIALASTEQYVSRFFREADIAASVQHPHFAAIYDFGQSEDQLLYIAMELLQGETLAAVARKRRLTLDEILEVASQVCAALTAAHGARIVHRDLKPDNIFLLDVPEGGPFVKVLDFGIAKDLDADNITHTGQLFGTPEYMSPEQCEGKARVDGRSDLYALGCILYELLTARSPFHRDSIVGTLLAQVGEEPLPFDEIGLPVPAPVEAIVFTLLEKRPDNRFADAAETRRAIEHAVTWLAEHPAAARAYHTVSDGLHPRTHASRTVSYSDLAHPLQLEGILGQSARSALHKQAEARQREESERETFETGDRRESPNGVIAAFVALIAVAGMAGFSLLKNPPSDLPPPVVIAAPPVVAIEPDPGEAAATDAARRAATASLISITSFAVSRPDVAEPPPLPETKRADAKEPDALLPVRTQSSVRERFGRRQDAFIACYDRREESADAGSVTFRIVIAPDGSVTSASAESMTLKSKAAIDCMRDVAAAIDFAPAATQWTHETELTFHTK